jgi:hypothetical protein
MLGYHGDEYEEGMLRRKVSYKLTDVAVMLNASIIWAMRFRNVGQILRDCTAQYPKDSHLHARRRENTKSNELNFCDEATLHFVQRFEVPLITMMWKQ